MMLKTVLRELRYRYSGQGVLQALPEKKEARYGIPFFSAAIITYFKKYRGGAKCK